MLTTEFLPIFRQLTVALPPKHPAVVGTYLTALHHYSADAVWKAAERWQDTQNVFPSPQEWAELAQRFTDEQFVARDDVVEGSRKLEELDDLAPNDPERDEISKRLSPEDQETLMARYGYVKVGRNWVMK